MTPSIRFARVRTLLVAVTLTACGEPSVRTTLRTPTTEAPAERRASEL